MKKINYWDFARKVTMMEVNKCSLGNMRKIGVLRKHSASGGMLVSAREGKKTHICVFLPPPIQTPLFFLNLE